MNIKKNKKSNDKFFFFLIYFYIIILLLFKEIFNFTKYKKYKLIFKKILNKYTYKNLLIKFYFFIKIYQRKYGRTFFGGTESADFPLSVNIRKLLV